MRHKTICRKKGCDRRRGLFHRQCANAQKRRARIYAFVGSLLGVVVFLSSSCGSYTYINTTTNFPTNATNRTEYTLVVEAHGQVGKAYIDFGPKRVFVIVFHKGSPYSKGKYTIEAGDLDWEVRWDEFSSPQIRFFDRKDTNKTIRTVSLKINLETK
jgi:hypothetical protein